MGGIGLFRYGAFRDLDLPCDRGILRADRGEPEKNGHSGHPAAAGSGPSMMDHSSHLWRAP